jgi:hypothetical protein
MQYKRTVARIGVQFPRWFRVEGQHSVGRDGTMSWIAASNRANERTGKWTEDEDSKLNEAVRTQNDKD